MKKINMKIKGLKKAVGEYKRFNAGGTYSPEYGVLMYDKSDRILWTDYFFSIGHNSWKVYHSDTVVNLGRMMAKQDIHVSMESVKNFIENNL